MIQVAVCERSLAMRRGTPVVTLHGWRIPDADGPSEAATPEEAVASALGPR